MTDAMGYTQSPGNDLFIGHGMERREYVPRSGQTRLCTALETQLLSLEQHLLELESILDEPDLGVDQRKRLLRQINDTELAIMATTAELQDCRSDFTVIGVERTQSTQFFLINGQGSGAASNNSVPLIAQRTLVLRVYVNYKRATVIHISGRVTVERLGSTSVRQVAILNPINGPIPGRSASAIDRSDPDHTLNFRLSAADCWGLLRFTVQVFDVPEEIGGGIHGFLPAAETVQAPERSRAPDFVFNGLCEPAPVFRIRGVLIHYTGNGQNLPAPTQMDFHRDCEFMISTYPMGRIQFTGFIPHDFGGDLTLPGTGAKCGQGWKDLLKLLRTLRGGSDDDDIYVALVHENAFADGTGCGSKNGAVAAALARHPEILAQEVGHAFGRKHAPSGGAMDTDPNYPKYDSYPDGSIGEFGFNCVTSKVHNPASTFDFMGRDTPKWISPYTFSGPGLKADMVTQFGPPDSPRTAAATPREILLLQFRLYRDGTIAVQPSFHLPSRTERFDRDPAADISCELLGQDGEVLVYHRCHVLGTPDQDPDGPFTDFFESLPWAEQATSIRFLRGKEILHVHEIEEAPPDVDVKGTRLAYDRQAVELKWKARHRQKAANELTHMLRHSSDGGRTWRVIASGLPSPSYRLDPRWLSGGQECCLQVVASSGIRTTVVQGEVFASPLKPRTAYILSPDPMTELPEGSPVVLRGGASSADFGLGEMTDVTWISNLDGPIGRGFDLVAPGLSNGSHLITFTAPDGISGVATESISIRIGGPP